MYGYITKELLHSRCISNYASWSKSICIIQLGCKQLIVTSLSQGIRYFKLQTKHFIILYLFNLFDICYIKKFLIKLMIIICVRVSIDAPPPPQGKKKNTVSALFDENCLGSASMHSGAKHLRLENWVIWTKRTYTVIPTHISSPVYPKRNYQCNSEQWDNFNTFLFIYKSLEGRDLHSMTNHKHFVNTWHNKTII